MILMNPLLFIKEGDIPLSSNNQVPSNIKSDLTNCLWWEQQEIIKITFEGVEYSIGCDDVKKLKEIIENDRKKREGKKLATQDHMHRKWIL
jgi:hypothetical protein